MLSDCVLKLKIGVLKLFCQLLMVDTSLSHFIALSFPVHIQLNMSRCRSVKFTCLWVRLRQTHLIGKNLLREGMIIK